MGLQTGSLRCHRGKHRAGRPRTGRLRHRAFGLFRRHPTPESGDKAKTSAAANLGSEQGLTVLANDTQAKANAAQLSDRSIVAQPHQLPTVTPLANAAVEDMPVTVAVDSTGANAHETGPAIWKIKIAEMER